MPLDRWLCDPVFRQVCLFSNESKSSHSVDCAVNFPRDWFAVIVKSNRELRNCDHKSRAYRLIFSATTYDSASYILASSATRRLEAGDDPPRWHRLFWVITLTVLPLALMFIGGYEVLQTAVLVVSLPILVIGVFMSVALVKQLGADHKRGRPQAHP